MRKSLGPVGKLAMQIFQKLASVTTPDGQDLTLHGRGKDFFVYLDGEELMSTRQPDSERRLAELGCEHLPQRRAPRMLIGGLGLGFTLRAALDLLPVLAEIVVVEYFAEVVEWQRRYLVELHGQLLADRRVRVQLGDVWESLAGEQEYDAVLLDVDDGPAAWCLNSNGRLYGEDGLRRIHQLLRPEGVLAVWSAQEDPKFVKRLRKAGFEARSINARGHQRGGVRHTIFLGRKASRAPISTSGKRRLKRGGKSSRATAGPTRT